MGLDYYKILGVDKGAKDDDLKNAYRNFAVRWRPDSNEAGYKVKQISEAYEILSDPQKRAIYDQYGEEGLKGQVPPGGGSTFFSSGGDGPTWYRFNHRSPDGIAASFGLRPFGGMVDDGSTGSGVREGAAMNAWQPRKAAPVEKRPPCSLEDLYKGATRKMKISREMLDGGGKTVTVEESSAINIEPGSNKGTKITFTEEGREAPSVVPAGRVFIANERPHDVFAREGNDLIATKRISLVEALTSYTARVTAPDGRSLTVQVDNVIHPEYEEVVPREGMPVAEDPSGKGNLRIRFDIKFPARLTAEQKAGIKKLLDSVDWSEDSEQGFW